MILEILDEISMLQPGIRYMEDAEIRYLAKMLVAEYGLQSISDTCRDYTIRFVMSEEPGRKGSAYFLKGLTKCTRKMINEDVHGIEHLLEKIYYFNIEGAKMAAADKKAAMRDEPSRLEAHFYRQAGETATVIFDRISHYDWIDKRCKIVWATRRMEDNAKSGDLIVGVDLNYAIKAYESAGDAARRLRFLTMDNYYKNKAEKYYNKCIKLKHMVGVGDHQLSLSIVKAKMERGDSGKKLKGRKRNGKPRIRPERRPNNRNFMDIEEDESEY